jgi:hypothetical protein
LFNDFEWIGNSPGPKRIPYPIDLIFDVTRYHSEIHLTKPACRKVPLPPGTAQIKPSFAIFGDDIRNRPPNENAFWKIGAR